MSVSEGRELPPRCKCRRHPIWLSIDAVVWLVLDRTVLVRRRCPIHGKCHV